jgi:AcrR family transcriptional regulator
MKATRSYTMRARAASVEETRRRILQATFDLAADHLVSEIGLDMVARQAEVSVQTVLRHFGSRAGLVQATTEYGAALVAAERRAPEGDPREAVRLLVDHYETRGDSALLLLAQERTDETVRAVVEGGRGVHRTWVEESFGDRLAHLEPDRRLEALDLLAVVTDVYTWKLLRRDQGSSRTRAEARIAALVAAVLTAAGSREET